MQRGPSFCALGVCAVSVVNFTRGPPRLAEWGTNQAKAGPASCVAGRSRGSRFAVSSRAGVQVGPTVVSRGFVLLFSSFTHFCPSTVFGKKASPAPPH